ncbi:putative DNA polymerase III [Vibrio phage VPMCC14]|nr:putative DNA polymerase III [Vibrio phage VPMCC14]
MNISIMYGAAAPKIATMLGVNKDTGQKVIEAFWNGNIGLRKRKEALEKVWEASGKKYIIAVDGRKIWTRSKHSLLNCYLQSGGAIGMDLAGILWHERALEEGLLDKGVARTIYYHKLIVASHREVCRKTPLIQGNLTA